jgi:hypothetical protein
LLACCVWLRAHKPGLYHRRQLVTLEGDINHQHTLNAADPERDEVVHFYLPANGRDQPASDDDVGRNIDAEYEIADDDRTPDDRDQSDIT